MERLETVEKKTEESVETRVETRLIAPFQEQQSFLPRSLLLPIILLSCIMLSISSCIHPTPSTPLPPHILIQYEEAVQDSFDIMSPTIQVPTEKAGYTLICPKGEVHGLVVTFHGGRDTSHPGFEQRLAFDALQRRVGTLYITTGHKFDFLFDTSRLEQIDRYLSKAIKEHDLPADKIMFTGMSLAGTRAMKMALWSYQGFSSIKPKALALCDSPLDFVRFWKAQHHTIIHNTHPISVGEASWVNYLLEQNLGGTPIAKFENYVAYSPYVKLDSIDSKLKWLLPVAIRIYTEPDMDWWQENRSRDAYGMNSLDASALVGDLRILGNTEAFHITSQNKGYRPDGTRHPHSWSIVDNGELIDWFLGLD